MKLKKRIFILFPFLILLLFLASLYIPFPKERLNPALMISLRFVDHKNTLLREVLSDEGGRCHWIQLNEISPYVLHAAVAAEDKHFYLHPGVDFLAIARAFIHNLKRGKIVSGASTITQQLIRNMYHGRRNVLAKVYEAWLALRLERSLSKEEILIQYLNRICYGNQAYGIEAASRLYFNKPACDLSLAQAAFLAGLPNDPSHHNPYRYFTNARQRQREILQRMHALDFISQNKLKRALEEELNVCSEKGKFRAPHFCDFILKHIPLEERRKLSTIQTTLDYPLQQKVEQLVKFHVKSLETRGISNAAVVVLDNITGNILSMIGSKDFFDSRHDGQVNGAISLRQPGSTLKPFTYALALEKGMTAATIIEDSEIQLVTPEGVFRPQNYDRKYHGPIRMRSALACSYNVPAVSVLQTIGTDLLYQRLKKLHFESLKKSPSFYGIGLTLGNGEVTLLELVRAYSALARRGIFLEEKSILKLFDTDGNQIMPSLKPRPHRVFSAQVAYIITHILADRDARIPSFGYSSPLNLPFPCASKTGTSKDFRDNWTVGYSPTHTVGVWVGNFDGKPMHNVSGITGCGPLFRDIMLLLGDKESWKEFEKPENLIRRSICPLSGKLAAASCPGHSEEIFIKGTEPQEFCFLEHNEEGRSEKDNFITVKEETRERIRISFPLDGDVFKIDPILRKEYQVIYFKASVPAQVKKVEWWMDNQKIGVSSFPFSFSWTLKPGFYTIKATVKMGNKRLESQSIQINVLL